MMTGKELMEWIKDNHVEKYVIGIVIPFNDGIDERKRIEYDIVPRIKTNYNGTKEILL